MSIYVAAGSAAFFAVAAALIARVVLVGNGGEKRASAETSGEAKSAKRLPVPRDSERMDLAGVDEAALAAKAGAANTAAGALVKRFLDIALSVALLVFLAPLLIVTALAVKIDSPGPVLYRQKRVGRGGLVFEVFKFRSMYSDAECDGPRYAAVDDCRITRVGHVIRRLRIDEIPQTINVLQGEMSFVGPRPERPEFVHTLKDEIPHYEARHLVKPGITGWAQVKYEYAASVDGAREKLRYDLFYIAKYSPLMDLAIVALTVRVALFGLGSR